MKCFKKLFSAALAAVLALTLLAGCSSNALDAKEITGQIGDFDGVTYQDAGESQAAVLEQMFLKSGKKSLYDYLSAHKADIRTALNIANDTRDFWFFSATAVSGFTSERFQKDLPAEVAHQILEYRDSVWIQEFNSYQNRPGYTGPNPMSITFLDEISYSSRLTQNYSPLSSSGTVSLKLITVGEKQYLIGVWKISAESTH